MLLIFIINVCFIIEIEIDRIDMQLYNCTTIQHNKTTRYLIIITLFILLL